MRAVDASRRYGAADPAFTAAYAGFVLGDGADDPRRHARLRHPRGAAPAPSAATPSPPAASTSGNYAISYAPGTLTDRPARRSPSPPATPRARYGAADPGLRRPLRRLRARRGRRRPRRRARLRHRRRRRAAPSAATRVTAGGLASGNYAITLRPGTLAVDPAPLTVTALDADRAASAPATPPSASAIDGFVLGEDAGDLDGALGFATAHEPPARSGSYAITPGGLASGNYAITYAAGTLTIAPARSGAGAARRQPTSGRAPASRAACRRSPPATRASAPPSAEAPPALGNPFGLTYSLGRDRPARAGAGRRHPGLRPRRRRHPGLRPGRRRPCAGRPPRRRLQRLGQPAAPTAAAGRPSPRATGQAGR